MPWRPHPLWPSLCKQCGEVFLRHLQNRDDGVCNVALCTSKLRLLGLQVGAGAKLDEGALVKVLQNLNGLCHCLCRVLEILGGHKVVLVLLGADCCGLCLGLIDLSDLSLEGLDGFGVF